MTAENTSRPAAHRAARPTRRTARRAIAAVAATAAVASGIGFAVSSDAATRPKPQPPHRRLVPPTPLLWPAAGAPVPAVPAIAWKTCTESSQRKTGLQCATVKVPLDYANPAKASILVDVVRHRASGARKGSVFVNPGGPGTTASDHMGRFLEVLGTPVTKSFDIVGMDPRGISVDSLAGCWSTSDSPGSPGHYPETLAQAKQMIAKDTFERTACATTGKPIIDHMTTADAARDMDLLRQAVGDSQLTYYGVSYGTVLGATYAQLFPSKVRALALDGVVDPIAWTTGYGDSAKTVPVSARQRSGEGADESLRAAFAACKAAGAAKCAHGATIAQEWDTLLATLAKGPVTVGDSTYSRPDTLSAAITSLYDPELVRSMMDWIHDEYLAVTRKVRPSVRRPAALAATPPSLSPALSPASAPVRPGPVVQPSVPQADASKWFDTFKMAGVQCSDSINPTDEMAWWTYSQQAAKTSWFSPVWAWNSSSCASWPGSAQDAYRGPFTVKPAHPLLVIGNTHDPATPYQNAVALAKMSPGARLVTLDGFGHAAGDQSPCTTQALQDYLVGGTLPAEGLVCHPAKPLF